MKKIKLTLWAILLSGLTALGEPLSPEQSLSNAIQQLPSRGMRTKQWKSEAAKKFKLAHTQKSAADSSNLIYVFNSGSERGFIVTGADDRLPSVIGYSENGNFSLADAPESLLGMMESWAEQAEWMLAHPGAKAAKVIKPQQAVEPLLGEIQWNQSNPYNKMCPNVTQYNAYGDKLDKKGPAATGCVATALSQIMYYHRWPEQGAGSVRYQSDNGDDVINISVNYDGETFDWDNMLPSLTSKSPAAAISAVSKLMYYVGTSFQSIYGMGTGASDISIAPAMKENWGYDKGIRYLLRDFYTEQEWNDMLQNELIAGRPVPYGGVTRKKAGHYFVLDGMNEEGYYHVNWGWGGTGNGYFRLELLLEEEPGTGSVNDAFSYQQNMVIGIQKPTGEPTLEQMCFTAELLTNFDETISRQGSASLKAQGVWNNSATRCGAKLGFALFDSEGNVVKRQIVIDADTYRPAYGVSVLESGFEFPVDLAVGTYTIRPIYQLEREEYAIDHVIRLPQGRADRWVAKVTDRNIEMTTAGKFKLNIKGVYDENGNNVGPKSKKLIMKIDNAGTEFQGRAQIRCYVEGGFYTRGTTNINGKGDQYNFINIKEGENEYVFDNTYGLAANDRYIFEIRGCEGRWDLNQNLGELQILASLGDVRIDGSVNSPALTLSDAIYMDSMADKVLPCNDVRARAYVHNEGGAFEGSFTFAVHPAGDAEMVLGHITFDPVSIERESDSWVSLENGVLPEACEIGGKYDLVLCWDEMEMSPAKFAKVSDVTIGNEIEKIGKLKIIALTTEPDVLTAGKSNKFTFEVGNSYYPFDRAVYFTLALDSEKVFTSSSQLFKINGGEYDFIEFEEDLPVELYNSDDYVLSLYDGADRLMDTKEGLKLVGGLSGIDSVGADVSVKINGDIIEADGAKLITVCGADGAVVATSVNGTLCVSPLMPGVYLVRITSARGDKTFKFIK